MQIVDDGSLAQIKEILVPVRDNGRVVPAIDPHEPGILTGVNRARQSPLRAVFASKARDDVADYSLMLTSFSMIFCETLNSSMGWKMMRGRG